MKKTYFMRTPYERGTYTAVITGATSGIGAAYARALAQKGFNLILTGRRESKLEATAADCRKYSVDAEMVLLDLTDRAGLKRFCDRLQNQNPAFVVNNAGFGHTDFFLDDDIDNQLRMLQVHAEAVARISHAVLPGMMKKGFGAVVNVSSLASFAPGPSSPLYCSTKVFINRFTESLSIALNASGVRMQSLCPGFTYTDFHDRLNIDVNELKKKTRLGWMSAESVVAYSLKTLNRNRIIAIPGASNRFLYRFSKLIPRFILYRLLQKQGRDFHDRIQK